MLAGLDQLTAVPGLRIQSGPTSIARSGGNRTGAADN
jgi:hypothetical protein